MKKVLIAAILVGLSSTSLVAAPTASESASSDQAQSIGKTVDPLTPFLDQFQQAIQNTQNAAANLKTQALALQKTYENTLYALNKSKGYDPRIYKRIVIALDNLNDITAQINDLNAPTATFVTSIKNGEKPLVDAFDPVDDSFLAILRDIKVIEKMTPTPPTTFPERCADVSLAGQYTAVAGFIEKGTGAPTGWALRPQGCENEKCMIPISPTVGLIGTGEKIEPSWTPPNYVDSGWSDGKQVVCLKHAEVVTPPKQ